ncbi:hypothetical protein DQ04_02821080 [Trypanosoma grayi]|uniref:hypothetical protein n=1 Tax=Trypanosoma grayi TaxID=71804 RepID=UPI0004F4AAE6|nr:hypothetical protein DQ04_02821080 [Trypanosoma grayi]KEG11246.1 hypothetical protein DQ04_02821080 [Trypanosoma grayi]
MPVLVDMLPGLRFNAPSEAVVSLCDGTVRTTDAPYSNGSDVEGFHNHGYPAGSFVYSLLSPFPKHPGDRVVCTAISNCHGLDDLFFMTDEKKKFVRIGHKPKQIGTGGPARKSDRRHCRGRPQRTGEPETCHGV